MSFFEKINHAYETMTHSQQMVAQYYRSHEDRMAFLTLEDAAAQIGTSTTTIIRFARSLGYSGYSQMQKDIQSSLISKVSLPERLNNLSVFAAANDQLLNQIVQSDIQDITETVAGIAPDLVSRTIHLINDSRNIYVLGLRSSFSLAHYLTSRLGQIRPNVRLIQSAGMLFPEELAGCNSSDACVAFLFPRYSKTAANLILWLKKRNVKIILFTSNDYKAVESYGDLIIPCSVSSVSIKNSFVAPMVIINYLMASIALLDHDRTQRTLEEAEDFLNKGYHLGL